MKFYNYFNVISLLCLSQVSLAAAPDWGLNVAVSPFLGTGETSTGATVENNVGIKIGVEKLYNLPARFVVGPKFDAGNNYLTTKSKTGSHVTLSEYDNRFLLGGLTVGRTFGRFPTTSILYLSATTGRGWSNLERDESGDDYYAEQHYRKIEGPYSALEVGTHYKLKRGFSVNLAAYYHHYEADQKAASGTVDAERATPEFGIQKGDDALASNLESKVTQKTYGALFGFTLGF